MGKPKKYDFSGWATRSNVKCSDGRIILSHAFKDNDGSTVPLVWNHDHNNPNNVLGYAYLENRENGVYAYCSFNDTENGNMAKKLVCHGDICALSIYANQLKQNGSEVVHGNIREVSLVLAGANPEAFIENVLTHSDSGEEEAKIFNSEAIELFHAEDMENKDKESDMEEKKEKTVQEVVDSMTEEQKQVLYLLVGMAAEGKTTKEENDGGSKDMKHNAFEKQTDTQENTLSHSEFMTIISDAKKNGSVKDAFLAHGITSVENLFPEVKNISGAPATVAREMSWVKNVMGKVKHTPFSRVKSTYAVLTADEARAKGYVKGKKKVEEVITAFKRSTTPQTVYKLQKLDRDDVVDITDFDVVVWIKNEMRLMLEEELARAILIGDGRDSSSDDKINPMNIRPIYGDNEVYTIKRIIEKAADTKDEDFTKTFIKDIVRSRKDYKGSGNPTLYTTEDTLTEMLLLEDVNGRVIYDTMEKLKTALRVTDIVTVPVMEGTKREDGSNNYELLGVLVNLADYNVGADKGGAVNMFDDFDINYNKLEYLIETRCSGALVVPYSAITFEKKTAKGN